MLRFIQLLLKQHVEFWLTESMVGPCMFAQSAGVGEDAVYVIKRRHQILIHNQGYWERVRVEQQFRKDVPDWDTMKKEDMDEMMAYDAMIMTLPETNNLEWS